MTPTFPAAVLLIDDVPGSLEDAVRSLPPALSQCFQVRFPDDVTDEDLSSAHLILVDYKLDHWAANDARPEPCFHIENGLALTAVLQQRTASLTHPIAFAIHSSHLPELTHPFSAQPRLHLLSRICNVDWAFQKGEPSNPEEGYSQIHALAQAVAALPRAWPVTDSEKMRSEIERLLSLDSSIAWVDQAWDDILRCHPPLDELIWRIHGLLFLRWLLHRILSYPCFLLDEFTLAARLAVTTPSLRDALSKGLADLFAPAEYRGILSSFRGRRWWRIGIEYLVWKLAEGRSPGIGELRESLIKKQLPLLPTKSMHPVVCLDTDFLPMDHLYDPIEAVRIMPDDWPPYADPAWATIELAQGDQRVRGLVITGDRDRLPEGIGE